MKKLLVLLAFVSSASAQTHQVVPETRTYYLPGRLINNPTPVEYWRRNPPPVPSGYVVQVTPVTQNPLLQPSPNDPPLEVQQKITDLSR